MSSASTRRLGRRPLRRFEDAADLASAQPLAGVKCAIGADYTGHGPDSLKHISYTPERALQPVQLDDDDLRFVDPSTTARRPAPCVCILGAAAGAASNERFKLCLLRHANDGS